MSATLTERLRAEYATRLPGGQPPRGEALEIELPPGCTGYNHTAIEWCGEIIYFVRVDGGSEYASQIRAFHAAPNGRLVRDLRFPAYNGQDPRVEHIGPADAGYWVLNYTELGTVPRLVQWLRQLRWLLRVLMGNPQAAHRRRRLITSARFRRSLRLWLRGRRGGLVRWRTRFHAGWELTNLPSIGVSRWTMKNFAFVDGYNGLVGVFGRPMGKLRGGPGQINLHLVFARSPGALRRRLRPWRLWLAPIIHEFTDEHCWAGVNSATAPPAHIQLPPPPLGPIRSWVEFSLRYGAGRLLWPLLGRFFHRTAFADRFGVIAHLAEWTRDGVKDQRWYAGTSSVLWLRPLVWWIRPHRPRLTGYQLVVTPESAMHLAPDPKRPDLRHVAFASRVILGNKLLFGACDRHACILPVDNVYNWGSSPDASPIVTPQPAVVAEPVFASAS